MVIKFLVLLVLIVINGVFSATEIAFLSINKYKLSKAIKNGNAKAKMIATLLEDNSTFLSAIQIAITLSGFLASAFAAESFASELASILTISFLSKETLTTILIVLITMILSYFTLVFGELVPKKIGLNYSYNISFKMVGIVNFVITLCKPFIIILKSSTDTVTKLLKIKNKTDNIEDDIKNSINDADLEKLEKQLLLNVFDFNDITLDKVMTKKSEVVALDINSSKKEVLEVIKNNKFTRFLVFDGDDVGFINIKDFFIKYKDDFKLKDYVRKITKLKDTMIIDDAFLYLNANCEAIALVEHDGEYVGIVTLEDIIEELIGNIFDEYN